MKCQRKACMSVFEGYSKMLLVLGITGMMAFGGQMYGQQPVPEKRTTITRTPMGENGADDFDFEIGVWRTQLKRLSKPLSGSDEWVSYEGTSVVRELLEGRANVVELKVEGPAGRIEGVSLRLFNPDTRQWSLNFANIRSGELSPPSIGSFKDGRGEFYSKETYNGREILVRFVVSDITPNSCRFEQAYSEDGGKTWEVNWIAVDTRELK